MAEPKEARHIVHWPGQSTAACDDHAEKLANLARDMGFLVASEPCYDRRLCQNCVNEVNKANARG